MQTKPNKKVIKVPGGMICDYIDGKFRKDTPEEYVRQTVEKRLINEHKYRRNQIKVEFGLKLGSRPFRREWMASGREWMASGSVTPIWMLVVQLTKLLRYTQKKTNGVALCQEINLYTPRTRQNKMSSIHSFQILRKNSSIIDTTFTGRLSTVTVMTQRLVISTAILN